MTNYRVQDSIGIVEISGSAVNALSYDLRKRLVECVSKAKSDDKAKCIVICAKGKTWPAGADISEFSSGKHALYPTIVDDIDGIEESEKPVVAALHGTVLGGGLELALAAHYRIADKRTSFGYPEVMLGILPGATGTQRFPRLCGLKAALQYIPTGKRFNVRQATDMGLVDQVAKGDLLEEAMAFAKSVQNKPVAPRRVSNMTVKDTAHAQQLMDAAILTAKRRSRGMIAPIMCIQAVMASARLPYEQGILKEQELSLVLGTSGQARALQYAFFAERSATKWRLPSGASFKDNDGAARIKSGAVIGAGTMGTGIAMAMLNAGIPVVLVEQNKQFLDKGVVILRELYAGSVQRKLLTQQQADFLMSQLTPSLEYSALKDADIVVEAVYENLELKQQIFRKLDAVCKPEAVLASNTSYLSIDKIASSTKRPEKVIGTHFFVPAYYMRLLENIYHNQVSPQTVATAMSFGKRIGKVPVLVGTCDGFVGNRMLSKYAEEAGFLLEEGCLPPQVDNVMEEFGFPLGVFKVRDLSGLDIGWRSRKGRAKALGRELEQVRYVNGVRTSYLADVLCEQGRFGRKTGKGWYKYEKAGAKVPFNDPEVEKAIVAYSTKEAIPRRKILDQEVQERCVYSMINEGFKILEEGIAAKPQDIDTVWLLGYGFPRYRGGPMFYANQIGLQRVYERVCYYYAKDPSSPHWVPSALLKRLAHNNVPLEGWMHHVTSLQGHSKL